MKAKISRGKGFKGALDYVCDEQKGGQVVGGNMSSDSAAELSSEFKVSRALRPDCQKPVWHCSLSLPQGERLSDQKWQEVTNDYMQRMELDPANHQFVAVRHQDTEYDHIHIIASRIGLDSKLWHGQHDVRKAINACQELEQIHGLTLTPGLDMNENHKSSLKRGEIELAVKNGEAPPKLVLQQAIDETLTDNPTTSAFIERLEAAGINVKPNIASTGRMNGFSFEVDGVAFKASQLGKSYSFGQLCKRGLDYDQERDANILRSAKERSMQSMEDLSGPDNTQNRQYKRTIDYMQEVEPGRWRFESGRRVVVEELESGGVWVAKTDTAAKAALQLALDKGWSTITVKTEDKAHAERLYRAALKVGYPPHVITLAHDQLTPEQIQGINKEYEYEQNRASQSVSDAAQQSDFSADQRAATAAKQQRRELGSADRASGSEPSGAERREPRSDTEDSKRVAQGPAPERPTMGTGSDPVGRSNQQLETRAQSLKDSSRQYHGQQRPGEEATPRGDMEGLDRGNRHERNNGAGATDRIHSLAAPAQQRRASSSEVLQRTDTSQPTTDTADRKRQPVAPHIKAKLHAFDQQHEALQAPVYRLTLTARRDNLKTYNMGKNKGPEGAEKFYTANEVKDLIPTLSRQNARGYDIYVTPIDPDHHYIVLDDSDAVRLQDLQQRTGIKPCYVQESSTGNLQAIIKADRQQGNQEQSNANFVVQGLNKGFGDPQFSGVVHPFRLAGFANAKTKHEINGQRPIVRPKPTVVILQKGSDQTANAMLEKQRKLQQEQEQRKKAYERTQMIESFNQHSRTGADERYKELAQKYCKYVDQKGWERDWSRIDYAIAGEMLKQDYYSENQIEEAIKENSPGIDERKQDPAYYARQTVEKAAHSPEVQQHREQNREMEMEM